MQAEIDGQTIATILKGPDGDAMAVALVGCVFFTDNSDDFAIEAADAATESVIVKATSGTPVSRPVATGSVVPSERVQVLADSYRARAAAPRPNDVRTLREAGVTASMSREDTAVLARILARTDLPNELERSAAVKVMAEHRLQLLRIETVRKWLKLVIGPVPLDLNIQTAWCQRKLDKPEAALQTLDRVLDEVRRMPGQQVIPLTQMAATLIDLYDATGDADYLLRARRSYEEAFGVAGKSSHLRRVRNHLLDRENRRGSGIGQT